MTSGIEAFYETREKNLSVDLSVDLSVECGYYDELYMDVLDVTVLHGDKHAAFKAVWNTCP